MWCVRNSFPRGVSYSVCAVNRMRVLRKFGLRVLVSARSGNFAATSNDQALLTDQGKIVGALEKKKRCRKWKGIGESPKYDLKNAISSLWWIGCEMNCEVVFSVFQFKIKISCFASLISVIFLFFSNIWSFGNGFDWTGVTWHWSNKIVVRVIICNLNLQNKTLQLCLEWSSGFIQLRSVLDRLENTIVYKFKAM